MRKLPALIVVAGLLATLTACTTASAPGSSGCLTPASGDASAVVSASTNVGSEPTVSFPTPIVTSKTEVSVVKAGHGPALVSGTPVLVKFAVYSGSTGKALSANAYASSAATVTIGSSAAGPFSHSLACSQVGSRLAIAMTQSDLSATKTAPSAKGGPADIVVVDIVKSFLPKADGALRPGANNMPAVVTAPDGQPGLSFPSVAAPDKPVVQLVRQGSGHRLTAHDRVVTKFSAFDWSSTPKVQGTTWTGQNGDPTQILPLDSAQLPSEIRTALIGQDVGSQVMVIVPAANGSQPTPPMVYVFDLLGSL